MASGGDLLSIGVSALNAFQASLATTGQNVANVNTPGYSRQRVNLESSVPQYAGYGYVGTGVGISSVTRVYNQFVNDQVLVNSTANSSLTTYSQFTSQVDNLLGNPTTGLSANLQNFFGSIQAVANDATSIPARQTMLSQGQQLVSTFQSISGSLNTINQGITSQLGTEVSTVNSLAQSIAKLNGEIVSASSTGTGQLPNDLLDQRDNLIQQLSQEVGVSVTNQDNGAKNIFIGNGLSLVVGTEPTTLSVTTNQYDTSQAEVSLTTGGSTATVTSSISGGTIGGLLSFRDQVLNPTLNSLGQVATGIAQTFNNQSHAGVTLGGQLGADFFTAPTPQVMPSSKNTGAASVAAQVSNVSALTTDDYLLQYDGSNYKLTDLTSNTSQTLGASGPFTVAGMTITTSGAASAGDSFMIEPTRTAAANIGMALSAPQNIAAAAPIVSSAAGTNTGNGAISAGTVTDISNAAFTTTPGALTPPISIVFTSPTAYNIVNSTSNAVLDTGTYSPGTAKNIFPSDNLALDYGYQVQITGAPAAGDSFAVNYNTNGTGDNRNVLALANIQTQGILNGGATSSAQASGQLVAKVGAQAGNAQNNLSASTALLKQAQNQQSSISGVNLDEEAANMLKFQQAYQAAAQVISIGSTLFNSLLSAVR